MLAGVTIVDPAATVIDVDVEIGQDTVIAPFTSLHGDTTIGAGSHDRPARDADRRARRRRREGRPLATRTEADDRRPRQRRAVRLPAPGRGSARGLEGRARSSRSRTPTSARGTKVPHLSYIGDADIGEGTNLGAGTITANYDGYRKHRTTIGSRVKTSVDTTFVAPVTVGDDAYTARRLGDHQGRAAGGARDRARAPAATSRATRERAQASARAAQDPAGAARSRLSRVAIARHVTPGRTLAGAMSVLRDAARAAATCGVDYDKRLMLVSGRANPELAARIAVEARRRARRGDAEDVRQRRGLLPLRGVGARRRRVHRAADVRQPRRRASAPTTR